MTNQGIISQLASEGRGVGNIKSLGGGGHRLPGALLDIEKGTQNIFPGNVGDGKGGRNIFPSYYA